MSATVLIVAGMFLAGCTTSDGPVLAEPSTTLPIDITPSTIARTAQAVRFVQPVDGAEIHGAVQLVMEAAEGLTVAPASEMDPNAGHFAVLVDQACIPEGRPMPGDQEGVHHFADGLTEKELPLSTGPHVLCLQFQTSARIATAHTQTIAITVR